ncbi:MAG TPA: BTAD domain-containing putative transcriptional regulator [Pseudonocardia sp.]|nr:BTAD domain-containing putative transcriptional regulator [Pseudonocardia sp.]
MVVVAAGVEFSVLGPVRAWRDGREVDLGSPQQCGVLGLLLLGGGRPVAVETLVDQLWGELAPSSARETVRTYLSRLRRALPAGESGSMIDSGRGGYALPLGPDALDLLVFEDRVARARRARADGDSGGAAGLLREALALWRGPALAGARGRFVAHERARLDQLRLVALEERLALDLDLGRHAEVLAELASLVIGYPLQERLRELQMLALYRCARQADALEVYRSVRGLLDRELGIEPGPDLRALHERMLRADPALDLPSGAGSSVVTSTVSISAVGISASTVVAGAPLAEPAQQPVQRPVDQSTAVVVGNPGSELAIVANPARDTRLPVRASGTLVPKPTSGRGVLADRLQAVRERGFVGRTAERALFGSALAGWPSAFVTLFLHGPGGVGKTTLLRRLADDATAAGRTVLRVDGRLVSSSTSAFSAAAGSALSTPNLVLMIDNFEQCQALESWLREDFLPQLPEDVLVVIAGRNPPTPSWRTDPSWAGALRVETLRDLSPADAAALLLARGVAPELHASLLGFAGGHPLALTLAAEVAARAGARLTVHAPSRDVIEAMLAQLVGTVPSPEHRLALQVCAHAYSTTEDLLRTVLPGGDAPALFSWLRGLPFIESGTDGIFPHDVVRDALEMDLHWRDPVSYEEIHRRVRNYVLGELIGRKITGIDALWTARSLRQQNIAVPKALLSRLDGLIEERALRPDDRAAVIAMAGSAEGAQSEEIARFWLARQPGAFTIYRHRENGELISFAMRVVLDRPSVDENAVDPLVAAAWEQAALMPPGDGEHIAVARRVARPDAHLMPSVPVEDPERLTVSRPYTGERRLAWSYLAVEDAEFWQPLMGYLDQIRIPLTPVIDGRAFGVFAHDWRANAPRVSTTPVHRSGALRRYPR